MQTSSFSCNCKNCFNFCHYYFSCLLLLLNEFHFSPPQVKKNIYDLFPVNSFVFKLFLQFYFQFIKNLNFIARLHFTARLILPYFTFYRALTLYHTFTFTIRLHFIKTFTYLHYITRSYFTVFLQFIVHLQFSLRSNFLLRLYFTVLMRAVKFAVFFNFIPY